MRVGFMLEFTARDRLKLLGGASALLLSACGGGSSSGATNTMAVIPPPTPTPAPPPPTPTPAPPPPTGGVLIDGALRDTFTNNFKIGAALSSFQVDRSEISAELAQSQFNSLTPEFQLKMDVIAPTEGVLDFTGADEIVDWALSNGMEVRGHALVWHEATPTYFLEGTRDEIRTRLENYVTAVVTHFRGRITAWDVVNETTSVDIFNGENGIGPDRRTEWFDAVGNADYIDWAFLAARAADPDALLFYNDYETENPIKQAWLLEILQRLQSRGVPIDGVGHQMHLVPDTVIAEALGAIDAVDNQFMGLINHVTELDLSSYQNPGSCWVSQTNCQPDIGPVPPPELLTTQAQKMRELFNGLKARSSVTSVTTWGVIDSDNWLNFVPVERFNYPLLFDRDGEPKSAFFAITNDNYVIG